MQTQSGAGALDGVGACFDTQACTWADGDDEGGGGIRPPHAVRADFLNGVPTAKRPGGGLIIKADALRRIGKKGTQDILLRSRSTGDRFDRYGHRQPCHAAMIRCRIRQNFEDQITIGPIVAFTEMVHTGVDSGGYGVIARPEVAGQCERRGQHIAGVQMRQRLLQPAGVGAEDLITQSVTNGDTDGWFGDVRQGGYADGDLHLVAGCNGASRFGTTKNLDCGDDGIESAGALRG